jgi:RES domain-containing protein
MLVYRIGYRRYAATPLDGMGSFLYGGRWSSAGTRMAYTSSTITLAMLEFRIHINFEDFDIDAPPELVYVAADVPESDILTLQAIGQSLPKNWDAVPAPASNALIGDGWVISKQSLALRVPSVHVPPSTPEENVLLNPAHQSFSKMSFSIAPFAYDRRLYR